MLEGIVFDGMDEGLGHWVDRQFGQHLYQHQAEDEVYGELLPLCQVVLLPPADREG